MEYLILILNSQFRHWTNVDPLDDYYLRNFFVTPNDWAKLHNNIIILFMRVFLIFRYSTIELLPRDQSKKIN